MYVTMFTAVFQMELGVGCVFERSLGRFKGHLPMKISKFRPSEMALSAIFMESRFVDFIISKYLAKNIV
jgi:hypothetical protein